jgi:small conductance mechanosensitive channel
MNAEAVMKYLFDVLASLGTKLLVSLVVLFVGRKLIKFITKWIKSSRKMEKVDAGVRTFLSSFAGVGLNILLFITIAMILGVPTTSFITALASCGVAIGLALQGALGNLAGGIMILIFKPFEVGNYLTTPDAAGTVSKITIMYTFLTTPDNKIITIPNGTLTNSVVENYSAVENRRVDLKFTTSYDNDVEKVKGILMEIISNHEKVLKDPEPFARLTMHGESGLEYTVRVWCKTEDYWNVNFDLVEDVKKAFDENGIDIPYPQMDIHIDNK